VRLGHVGFALLTRTARPRLSLALLVPIAYGPDIIEVALQAIGNRNRILSHSLISVGLMATVVSLAVLLGRRSRADAVAVWLLYVSHWPADFITGLKPTWPGGPEVGLQLYDHLWWDAALELALLAACWIVYRKLSPPSDRMALATVTRSPNNE
jgi:hypothetical protein